MKDGQKVKALRSSFSNKLNYYEEISKNILKIKIIQLWI